MLYEQIKSKIKESMLAKDTVALETYRGALSAFTNELVAKGRKPTDALSDEEALAVMTRLAKQRKDSIEQFRAGKREDLAAAEEAQLKIIEAYLPKMMERSEVEKLARAKKDELGISDASKKGMLMAALMKDLKGRADGAIVKEAVDALF